MRFGLGASVGMYTAMGRSLIDAEKPSQHRAAVPAAAIVDAIAAVLPARGAAGHTLRGFIVGHGPELGEAVVGEAFTQMLEGALTAALERGAKPN